MMKSILCMLAAALALIAQATPVSSSQAKQAARAWAQRNAAFVGEDAIGASLSAVAVTNADGVVLWHRVAMSNGSCLVVSPVTELEPVIACLENVSAEGLPSGHPMRAMLERDMADRLKKLGLYLPAPTGPTLMGASPLSATPEDPVMAAWAEEGKAKWERLVGGGAQLMAAKEKGVTEIAVLMGIVDGFEKGGRFTHWNQGSAGGGYCYNYHTPNHAVCGCVATMMSAIMQHFAVTGCPSGVTGVLPATYNNSDKDANGNPFVTLGGTYDWGCLTNSDGTVKTTRADYNSLTETQREFLGHVTYDAGVAIGMAWTDDESGAITLKVAEAFRKVFGFKDARSVSEPTEDQYDKLIYHQCMAGAPVGLSIHTDGGSGGHAVVAVGYGEDEEGVPRTRIFTGWGGTGDGWYALPYINTKSLPSQSGSYLYDVVAGVITMIGYDSDATVPVVGHVDAPGVAIDVPGVPCTTYANEAGYFGARVSPGTTDCRLLCNGKEAQFEIGAKAAMEADVYMIDEGDVSDFCDALPEYVEFVLLNSSVAYTFTKAKEMALAEGKAILRISGVTGTEPTTNLLACIYDMDKQNTGDFTNKFVYLFSSAKSSNLDIPDGNPSLGVFLPSEAEQSGRWQYTNGRLAYGYGYSTILQITTNDYAYAEDPEASEPAAYEYVTNQAYVLTWGQPGTEIYGVTNMHYDTAADGLTALTAMTQLVLDEGWAEFCRHTQGVTLTVTSSAGEIGTPTPAYGFHENYLYAGDDALAAYAPAEVVTNEAEGIVLEFKGWTLTNETTGAFQKGTGTNTSSVAVAPGDNLTLTWLAVTNAVWIEVVNADDLGTTTPESGWHPYGASSIVAKPEDGYRFDHWSFCEYPSGRGIATPPEASLTEQVLTFMATRPMVITANYQPMGSGERASFEAALMTTNTLTVVSDPTLDDMTNGLENAVLPTMPSVTAVVVHDGSSQTFAIGDSVKLPAVTVAVSLSSDVITVVTNAANGDGVEWRCTGWTLGGKEGVGSVAGVTLEGDATLTWKWEKVVPPEGPEDRQPAKIPYADESLQTSPLTIYANTDGTLTVKATIGNAVKGWWYVLKTAADLAGPYAKADGAECVKLADADGALELSTTFAPTEEKRFYKVTVEEDAP